MEFSHKRNSILVKTFTPEGSVKQKVSHSAVTTEKCCADTFGLSIGVFMCNAKRPLADWTALIADVGLKQQEDSCGIVAHLPRQKGNTQTGEIQNRARFQLNTFFGLVNEGENERPLSAFIRPG